jgi:outer membrane immunogenic protein
MKKSVLTSVAVGALALPCAAFAADLAVKAPALGRPAVMSWTGCHVGGHVGWGWSRQNINETGQTTAGPGPIPFTATGSLDTSGGMFGGQVGCDYQFASN